MWSRVAVSRNPVHLRCLIELKRKTRRKHKSKLPVLLPLCFWCRTAEGGIDLLLMALLGIKVCQEFSDLGHTRVEYQRENILTGRSSCGAWIQGQGQETESTAHGALYPVCWVYYRLVTIETSK